MLAITSTTAYEICVIKQNGACIDSYECKNTNYNYLLDLEGNKCATSCDSGKILYVKENLCSDSCDESFYILLNNQCGLCKYFYPDKPYKLINTSQCLSEDDIPEGVEIYNNNLYLLKCKSGYILKEEKCESKCYKNCDSCFEYSEDPNDQKCIECKDNFILEGDNCINPTTNTPTKINNTIQIDSITNFIEESFSSNQIVIDNTAKEINYFENETIKVINEEFFLTNQIIINNTTKEINYFENATQKSIIEYIFGEVNLTEIDNGKDKVDFQDDLIIILTSTKNQKINENEKYITLNLGDCENKLKDEYDIPYNDSLYILQFILEENGMKIPKMEYEIYYPLNQSTLIKLNLTTCIGTKVDISVKVSINDSLDKYNSSSDYYNDICTKAKSESNTDITINDRRNQFKENNMSLCEENCNFEDYDYDSQKAKCSCEVKLSIPLLDDIKFNKKDLYKSFIDIKNMMNLNVMKYFKEVFNTKSLKHNYGFYIVLLIILFYFICLFIFRFKSYIKLLTIINEIIFSLKAKNLEEKICEEKMENVAEKMKKILSIKKLKLRREKEKVKS